MNKFFVMALGLLVMASGVIQMVRWGDYLPSEIMLSGIFLMLIGGLMRGANSDQRPAVPGSDKL